MTSEQGSSAVFKQSLARCQRENTRLFVVLAGSQSWGAATALVLLEHARRMTVVTAMEGARSTRSPTVKPPRAAQFNPAVWIAEDLPAHAVDIPGLQHVHRMQAQQLLGNETSAAVIDAHDGLNANTLAAVTGTLCGGGLFILLTPPLDAWPHYDDPDYQRMPQPAAGDAADTPTGASLFLTRMVSYLRGWAGGRQNILLFEDNSDPATHDFTTRLPQPGQLRESSSNLPPPGDRAVIGVAPLAAAAPRPTTGQQRLRDAAAALYQRRAGSLLLTAARGRGKSTALAFAVFDALLATSLEVVVVAPHRSNVALFFSTLHTLCSDLPAATIERVSYHPADALLQDVCRTA